tara:strand:- start:3436 stop:5907 length:2472 start_codon:yes stop_codon:yes gene_type:complete
VAYDPKSQQQLIDLLNKIIQSQATPATDPKLFKKAESLFNALRNAATAVYSETVDAKGIRDALQEDLKTIELYNMVISEGRQEYHTQKLNALDTAKTLLQEKIKSQIESGKISDKELKDQQKHLKIVAKQKKQQEQLMMGEAKGAYMAELALQSTMGIRTSFMGPRGIVGSIKGFGKGMKEGLNAANILMTVLGNMATTFLKIDQAAADFFKNTGQEGMKGMFIDLNTELSLALGPNAVGIAQETLQKINAGTRTYTDLSMKERYRMGKNFSLFARMGVSTNALVDLSKNMRLGMIMKNGTHGMTINEQEKTMMKLLNLAKDEKRPPEEIFREAAEQMPVLMRYGRRFPQVFAGIALAAKRANMSVSDMMSLTERLDKSDDVTKQVAKFNALLGGNFLDPIALLKADPGEKAKIISEALKSAEMALGKIHPRIVRDLSQRFSISSDKLMALKNAKMEDYDKKLEAFDKKGQGDLSIKLNMEAQKGMSAKEKAMNILATITAHVFGALTRLIYGVIKMATSIWKWATTSTWTAPLRMMFSADELADGNRKMNSFEKIEALEQRKLKLEEEKEDVITKLAEKRDATKEEKLSATKKVMKVDKDIRAIEKFQKLSETTAEQRKEMGVAEFSKQFQESYNKMDQLTRKRFNKVYRKGLSESGAPGSQMSAEAMAIQSAKTAMTSSMGVSGKAFALFKTAKNYFRDRENRKKEKYMTKTEKKLFRGDFAIDISDDSVIRAKPEPIRTRIANELMNQDPSTAGKPMLERIRAAKDAVERAAKASANQKVKVNVGGRTIGETKVSDQVINATAGQLGMSPEGARGAMVAP